MLYVHHRAIQSNSNIVRALVQLGIVEFGKHNLLCGLAWSNVRNHLLHHRTRQGGVAVRKVMNVGRVYGVSTAVLVDVFLIVPFVHRINPCIVWIRSQ